MGIGHDIRYKRSKLRKKLSISRNTFVFLFLGRINGEKGINELIKAFNKISKNDNVLLIIVGPIEDKDLIQQIVDVLEYPVTIKQGQSYHGLEKL